MCLYREAIRLQCFPPTQYVGGKKTSSHLQDLPFHSPVYNTLYHVCRCVCDGRLLVVAGGERREPPPFVIIMLIVL